MEVSRPSASGCDGVAGLGKVVWMIFDVVAVGVGHRCCLENNVVAEESR